MTFTTWGRALTRDSIDSTCCCTWGSVTFVPPVVPITICSVSPDSFGATERIRSSACVDSVFGRVNVSEYAEPTPLATPNRMMNAASHAVTTVQRCVKHERARLRIR